MPSLLANRDRQNPTIAVICAEVGSGVLLGARHLGRRLPHRLSMLTLQSTAGSRRASTQPVARIALRRTAAEVSPAANRPEEQMAGPERLASRSGWQGDLRQSRWAAWIMRQAVRDSFEMRQWMACRSSRSPPAVHFADIDVCNGWPGAPDGPYVRFALPVGETITARRSVAIAVASYLEDRRRAVLSGRCLRCPRGVGRSSRRSERSRRQRSP